MQPPPPVMRLPNTLVRHTESHRPIHAGIVVVINITFHSTSRLPIGIFDLGHHHCGLFGLAPPDNVPATLQALHAPANTNGPAPMLPIVELQIGILHKQPHA